MNNSQTYWQHLADISAAFDTDSNSLCFKTLSSLGLRDQTSMVPSVLSSCCPWFPLLLSHDFSNFHTWNIQQLSFQTFLLLYLLILPSLMFINATYVLITIKLLSLSRTALNTSLLYPVISPLGCLIGDSKSICPDLNFCHFQSKSFHPTIFPISVLGQIPCSHPWLHLSSYTIDKNH